MRSFQEKWFQDRPRLEYFKAIDAGLCFPCRLFGSDKHDSTFRIKGFKQWNRGLEKNRGFDKHCCSADHEQSMYLWTQYLTTEPIDFTFDNNKKQQHKQQTEERQKRFDISPILIDVVSTLRRLGMPFRGHNESELSNNKGLFLEVMELISRWNSDVADHLQASEQNPKSYPSYASPTSQNELINCSAKMLPDTTVARIKKDKFFAICIDTTPDITKEDQLSIIVRYVDDDGSIKEDLLDVVHAAEMVYSIQLGLFWKSTSCQSSM